MKTILITFAILSISLLGGNEISTSFSSLTTNNEAPEHSLETIDVPRCLDSEETIALSIIENVSPNSAVCEPRILDGCIVCTISNVIDPPMTCAPCGALDC